MIVDQFSDYHDLNQYGLMVAKRFVETIDGHPHMTLNLVESVVGSYEAFATFEAAQMPSQSDNFDFRLPYRWFPHDLLPPQGAVLTGGAA